MSVIDEVLAANEIYSRTHEFRRLTPRPERKLAVLTCMDTRLSIRTLGLKEGDAHIIRNAGGIVTDDALRSLVVSHYLLGTEEFMVINHTDCGLMHTTEQDLRTRIQNRAGTEAISPPSSTRSRTSKKMSATNCRSSAPIPGFPSPSPYAALSTTLPAAISVKSSTPDSRPVSIIAPSARNSQEESIKAGLCLHCDFEENPRNFQRVIRPQYCLLSGWRWVWCSALRVVPGTCCQRSLP